MSTPSPSLTASLGTPSGLQCPSCRSSNCESFAWGQNYFSRDDAVVPETWFEPVDDPASVAARCAQPAFPKAGLGWRALDAVLSLGALGATLYFTRSFWIAAIPAVVIHVGMFILWSRLIGRQRLRDHEERVAAWKQARLCMDCGRTFAL